EATKCAAGRGVGVDGARVEGDVRYAVRPRRRVRGFLDDPRADVRVRADVEVGTAVDGDERAVSRESDAHRDPRAAAAYGTERVGCRRGEPHGPAGRAREHRRERLEPRV